ncbi:MAG: hypothetical protein PHY92_00240 [Alphaproteobacteria bacterium]|nr:hypothetical protein [Alphaproteobacteria bacterium]
MTHARFWLSLLAVMAIFLPFAATANGYKPDDRVMFDLSAEDWVTTKTARVSMNVEASVSGNTAGTTRAAMMKALDDLIKVEWRLISFNRNQDQTGMERWSAMFEARVPENMLSGINENAKKVSKPGMQVSVGNIDFTPTLDEMQTAMAGLRTKIYKTANEQLAALNTAMPGRSYRIALVSFIPESDDVLPPSMPQVVRGMGHAKAMMASESVQAPMPMPLERSEKISLTARVVMAVTPPAGTAAAPGAASPAPVSPPAK